MYKFKKKINKKKFLLKKRHGSNSWLGACWQPRYSSPPYIYMIVSMCNNKHYCISLTASDATKHGRRKTISIFFVSLLGFFFLPSPIKTIFSSKNKQQNQKLLCVCCEGLWLKRLGYSVQDCKGPWSSISGGPLCL